MRSREDVLPIVSVGVNRRLYLVQQLGNALNLIDDGRSRKSEKKVSRSANVLVAYSSRLA